MWENVRITEESGNDRCDHIFEDEEFFVVAKLSDITSDDVVNGQFPARIMILQLIEIECALLG